MPCVTIEVRKDYDQTTAKKIIDAVHTALQKAFKTLPEDKVVRLIRHDPELFACPVNLAKPAYYTLISIDAFTGRSANAKKELYQHIVENLEKLGIPKDHTLILLREFTPENWGIEGGQMASQVNLGYSLEV